jgi:hypothetical protein
MKELWIFIGIAVLWYVVQAYLLPKLGIST